VKFALTVLEGDRFFVDNRSDPDFSTITYQSESYDDSKFLQVNDKGQDRIDIALKSLKIDVENFRSRVDEAYKDFEWMFTTKAGPNGKALPSVHWDHKALKSPGGEKIRSALESWASEFNVES